MSTRLESIEVAQMKVTWRTLFAIRSLERVEASWAVKAAAMTKLANSHPEVRRWLSKVVGS